MNLHQLFPNIDARVTQEIIKSTIDTLIMVGLTGLIAGVLGIALGVVLVVTREGNILENKILYATLDKVVNLFRSISIYHFSDVINPINKINCRNYNWNSWCDCATSYCDCSILLTTSTISFVRSR